MPKPNRFEYTKDLEVNERFDFRKDDGKSYNKIQANLYWDLELNSRLKGLDLDACAFLVGNEGIIIDDANFVYYNSQNRWLPSDPRWNDTKQRKEVDVTEGNFQPFEREKYRTAKLWRRNTLPVSKDGALIGSWDDLGDSVDDDNESPGEIMHVILDKVATDVAEIIFCVSIYPNPSYGSIEEQTFDKVKNAKIEISDEETGNILCSFNLKEKFAGKTAVEVGKLAINDDNGEWEFIAFGEGHDGGIQTLADIYT